MAGSEMMIWESQRSLLVENVMSGMEIRPVGIGDRSEREEYGGDYWLMEGALLGIWGF